MPVKEYFEHIATNVFVDYENEEIQDICNAVNELMQRYARNIDERGIFKISKLLPCGSMAEKSSIWKTFSQRPTTYEFRSHPLPENEREPYLEGNLPYIEFDFLAILQQNSHCDIRKPEPDCPGCMEVQCNFRWNIKRHYLDTDSDQKNIPFYRFNQVFRSELCTAIDSMCTCASVKRFPNFNKFKFVKENTGLPSHCAKCTVYKNMGCLQIGMTREARFVLTESNTCTIVLVWESLAKSLFAPNEKTLVAERLITELHIFVDFLPAYEIEPDLTAKEKGVVDRFVVPKSCTSCRREYWRSSNNVEESRKILEQISSHHKKCLHVLKYMSDNFLDFVQSYHMKTTFLNHCVSCEANDKDYRFCVTEVLQELKSAYCRHHLPTSVSKANLCYSQADSHYAFAVAVIDGVLNTLVDLEGQANDAIGEYENLAYAEMFRENIREARKNSPTTKKVIGNWTEVFSKTFERAQQSLDKLVPSVDQDASIPEDVEEVILYSRCSTRDKEATSEENDKMDIKYVENTESSMFPGLPQPGHRVCCDAVKLYQHCRKESELNLKRLKE